MPHHLKLISFELCPYVERSRIVLLEKDLPHEIEFIDLANKPAWFLSISPMGRVPVLLVDGRPIFESSIINELLEELYPARPLFPSDPIARAEARGFIALANDVAMPAGFHALMAMAGGSSGDALAKPLAGLRDALDTLEAILADRAGPFFGGSAFSLVDVAFAPFLRRLRLTEGWGVPEAQMLSSFPAVSAWTEAVLAHPSVRAAEPPDLSARTRRRYAERAAKVRLLADVPGPG